MIKEPIKTTTAPEAIGPYSQAIAVGQTVYLSGQIPLDPVSMTLVAGDIVKQTEQVIKNLQAVCEASRGSLDNIVKLSIYLVDLAHFAAVNETMTRFFKAPYPARSTIEVSALPKGAQIEMDAIMIIADS